MENWVKNFVDFLEKDKKLSDNTLQSYRRDIEQYMNYIESNNIDLATSNKTTIITYLMYLQKEGRATSTISRNLASIRSYYQYLVRMKQISEDPTTGMESPKLEKKLPKIFAAIKEEHKDAFFLTEYTDDEIALLKSIIIKKLKECIELKRNY